MDDIIILVDENGEEQEYELLDTVEYEGTCEDSVIEEVYQIFKEKNTENYDFDD